MSSNIPESFPEPHDAWGETELPDVERPTTGFFVQLFVVPALIVSSLMLGWFLLDRFAGRKKPLEEYLAIIGSDRGDRWPAAHDLYLILSRDASLASNEDLARQIGGHLEAALAATPIDEPYAVYLAGALGWFHSLACIEPLRHACMPQHPDDLRQAALFALARLVNRLGAVDNPSLSSDVSGYLLADTNSSIRERAAYLLVHLADRRSESALVAALGDGVASVRFNAANALARLGNVDATPVLHAMLDEPALSQLFTLKTVDGAIEVDRATVHATIESSLRSLRVLRSANPAAVDKTIDTVVAELARHSDGAIQRAAAGLLADGSTSDWSGGR